MESLDLYKKLLTHIKGEIPGKKFENQVKFEDFNKVFFEEVYLKKKRKPGEKQIAESRDSLIKRIKGLKELCKKCEDFFLGQKREYNKEEDIELAGIFENALMSFLNSQGIKTIRGDDYKTIKGHHKGYPDLLILNSKEEEYCYLEVKYNAAPFIKISEFVEGRECYESPLTLNTIKLERQGKLTESEIKIPVYYVYWVDLPCLKGIFYTDIKNIIAYYQGFGKIYQHDRKVGNGDFSDGKKIGQTKMIYPPVLEMEEFSVLLKTIKESTISK